jgi:hypothetical protein
MQLVDFTTYVEAAEKLINENPLGLKRVALVSSEDPWVIHEASRLTRLDSGASGCLCPARDQGSRHGLIWHQKFCHILWGMEMLAGQGRTWHNSRHLLEPSDLIAAV